MNCLKTLCWLVMLLIVSLVQTNALQAQDVAGEGDIDPDAEVEEEVKPYVFSLGDFDIKDLRPTRDQTAKLKFTLYLSFDKSLTESQIEQLESWKHRLRDQVITSVRITEIKYFQERDLKMLSRKILIRVNRLFEAKLVEKVLFAEYMFRMH